ncbi:MAG: hypothetical protein V3V88_00055 [Dehalococcoidia bacterium]
MKNGAIKPPHYEAADVTAIQQLERGEAGPEMQKRALKWIIEEVCKTYDISYRPGDTHDTAFAEGKRFAGMEIVKMLKLDPSKLRRKQ